MIPDNRDRKSLLTTATLHQHFSYDNSGFTPGILRYPPNFQELGKKLFPFNKPKKNKERAVFKSGDRNIHHTNKLSKLGVRYLHDLFTSLVDIKWRYCLLLYFLAYYVSWLFFALIWWLIMFTHGDLEDEHLPQNQAESNWNPCVLGIHNFTSCYLFSLETQYTIGYGVRTTTEECPQAIFIMSMQAIIGMTIDGFALGIVFAKMTRPKLRNCTMLFSRNAVISKLEGELCLMFRVGDMRKHPLVGANIRAILVKPKRTKEGEILNNYTTELDISVDDAGNDIFFLWPKTVVHKINEDSPFYELSPSEILQGSFEIMVVLEATVESTGQSIQTRSSYISNEILWGYKFETIVDHLKHETAYHVNYSKFDNVYSVDTPLCSAAELARFDSAQALETRQESIATTFEDDEDDDHSRKRSPPPPPPAPPIPKSRTRSMPRHTVPRANRQYYEGYEENPLMEFTSSYV